MVDGARRRLPPVTALAVAALIVVLAGGIDLAAHLPRPAPLGPAVAALAVAVAALIAAAATLARVRDFAWHTFFVVGGWALAAYLVIAGMLEFVFVLDHTPGGLLVVLSLMLAVFAADVPLLLAFSVARYQPGPAAARPASPAGAAGAASDGAAPPSSVHLPLVAAMSQIRGGGRADGGLSGACACGRASADGA